MTNKDSPILPTGVKLMRVIFNTLGHLIPKTMGRYACKIWFTPTRFKTNEREAVYAKSAKKSFIEVNGKQIRIWTWGEGPAVLCIHGWSGRGTQFCSFVDELTNAGFSVISFDMPAHGESQGSKTNPIEISKVIEQIIKRIENLNSVMTHSFGGLVFAYHYSKNINLKNIIMICPPASVDTAIDHFSTLLKLPKRVNKAFINSIFKIYGEDIFKKLELLKNVESITQPLLVVHDNDDDIVPSNEGQEVASHAQQGTFIETMDLGHKKILHDNKTIKKIITFISDK